MSPETKSPAERAVEEAQRLHALNILMSDAEEEEMFRLGIGWLPPNGQRQACGTFVARCYAAAGMRADVRKYALASTYRLSVWGDGRVLGTWRPPVASVSRAVKVAEAQRGDILCVRTSGGKVYGDHVCLARGPLSSIGEYVTYEYNATTIGPDGKRRRGMGSNVRKLEDVRRVYRPAPEDFEVRP